MKFLSYKQGMLRGSLRKNIRSSILILLIFLFTFFNLCACFAAAENEGLLNSCGIVNRPLSVDPTGKSEGFSAVLYDNTNGLPTSEANAIAETSEGFIWIGSYAGLIRYDGNTFERMDSTKGITSVKALYVDSLDRLWIGMNDNGVAVMEKGVLRKWGKLEGMRSIHTRDITEDQNGNIYVATMNGIMVIDRDYNLTSMDEPEIAEADMRYLRTGIDGTVYGSTNTGDIIIIKDGKLARFLSAEENPLEAAGTFLPDPADPEMIYQEAPDFGLYHVDLRYGFKIRQKIDVDPLKYLMSMEYVDGKIWVTAGNGIGVIEDDRFRLIENLPMNNNVTHMMTDYLGNLWFTSSRQGVMKVVPNQFSDLSERLDLPEMVVNSTAVYDDMLFVATDTGLMVLDKDGPVEKLPLNKSVTASGRDTRDKDLIEMLKESRIRSIIKDSKDRLWISTWRGGDLVRYDQGDVTVFTERDGMLSSSIRSVSERKDGAILVALTGGVNVIEGDTVTAFYGKEDGIDNEESLTVTEGLNGDIILGSNGGGIYVINKDGVKNIDVEDGLPSDIVMRLKPDKKRDIIWIVASNAIAYMDSDYKVTTVEKFPYPNNFDLFENSRGDMWVLGSNGIYVTPVEELVANGDLNPVFYSTANGLSCIATANSYSDLTDDGDLYIAGSTGICKVNIDQSLEDVNDLKAVVPFVDADGERIYADEKGVITIPSTVRRLTVYGFVYNFSLSDPKVSYRLDGFDHQSTTVDRSEMIPVNYTNLRGGTYHFIMQLSDSMGRGNKEVSVKIVKEKAFYEETWFFILAAFIGLVLLFLIVRFAVQRRTRILERKQQQVREQFEQTSEALASAIDAKDRYTNGHSRRVAEYSVEIAREAGKSEEECDRVYFAALLHDVGKIGVPIEILAKKGRLTDEEFEKIKQHPVMGGQILSSIKNSPWLSVGARYHHERYNGKGYPEGLKGEDIPEIARIIAVADAYDAMTSNRSYRNAIPQHIVREELVKGIGTQFDPDFANIMIHMIDHDKDYKMQESGEGEHASATTSVRCDSLYHDCTAGISVTDKTSKIRLCSQPDDGVASDESLPTLIVYDSLDECVHPGEENNKNLQYFEYARVRIDGKVEGINIRNYDVSVLDEETLVEPARPGEPELGQRYIVEVVRYRDHMKLNIHDEKKTIQVILALPDTARFTYVAISGQNCYIHNIFSQKGEIKVGTDEIPRIAEEISYIKDCPEGDVPNVQVDSWCGVATEGIPVNDGVTLRFHSMSLPTARLVWHCPYISLFTSSDGQRDGEGFREYLLLRLTGEDWDSNEYAENKIKVEQREAFEGWDDWKEKNRQGFDCTVRIRKEKNRITITTENFGVAVESVTQIKGDVKEIYAAITGDQCAVTNIRVSRED